MQRRAFSSGLSFLEALFDVGLGGGVVACPGEDDGVDGSVEFAVSSSVESVADCLTGGGGDGCGTGEGGEGCFAVAASWVRPGLVDLCGHDGPDPGFSKEVGAVLGGEDPEVLAVGLDLCFEVDDAAREPTQGIDGGPFGGAFLGTVTELAATTDER